MDPTQNCPITDEMTPRIMTRLGDFVDLRRESYDVCLSAQKTLASVGTDVRVCHTYRGIS